MNRKGTATGATRREFLVGSAAVATVYLAGCGSAKPGAKTFTILHTNDLHSNLIGLGPASDYTTGTLNDDKTRGGFARLATLIAQRKAARSSQGPVLILDAGDYSMGTAFGSVIGHTGAELQLLARMAYDATTFGNHDFDLGPEVLASAIDVAAKAGHIPAVVASNTDFSKDDATLAGLKDLGKEGLIRRHLVIERGGLRFGLFGLMGKESMLYTNASAITYPDAIETAKEMVRQLRETEKVDLVICLSHGGVEKNPDGTYTDGEDVRLAKAVPGIDVVIGAHTHTELHEAIIVNGRTPVVQTGMYGRNLGELVINLDEGKLTVESYKLIPIDDAIPGDTAIAAQIEGFKPMTTAALFASRGYSIDQPLCTIAQDLPNTFADIPASTPLSNLVTDAFRKATQAEIGFSVNGTARSGLTRGKSGLQTVYDVYAVAPLGAGVLDPTAGSTLVTGWFTAAELKNLLEFFLVDSPAHPGDYFPRSSGMRFRYDTTRPKFDVVTAIELGDLARGYTAIDMTRKNQKLYSLTCSLYVGMFLMSIPTLSKGQLPLVPKNKDGRPLASKVEALDTPRVSTPDLLPPQGAIDPSSIAAMSGQNGVREIKEWQAIMDHLRSFPPANPGGLPTVVVDARAGELRAIKEN
jgi:5'-nucleotidase / UDP-sugar diphosphatase